MNGPRAIGLRLVLGLTLAAFFVSSASAQLGGGQGGQGGPTGQGGRRGQSNTQNRTPLPDQSASPRTTDPEAYDAIDLYSRLCVSTRGDRARATEIVGDGDTAIEKMDAPMLRGMENGQSGGVGWIIRMPLGDKILLEFPPNGGCVVRAPRVNARQMEMAFQNLLDQYGASGQFTVHRIGEQTKTVDPPPKAAGNRPEGDDPRHAGEKLKYHILAYHMTLPDTDTMAEMLVATTDSKETSIQATLTFTITPDSAGSAAH